MASVQSSLGGNSFPVPSQYEVVYVDFPLPHEAVEETHMFFDTAVAGDESQALRGHDNLVEAGWDSDAIQIRRGWLM